MKMLAHFEKKNYRSTLMEKRDRHIPQHLTRIQDDNIVPDKVASSMVGGQSRANTCLEPRRGERIIGVLVRMDLPRLQTPAATTENEARSPSRSTGKKNTGREARARHLDVVRLLDLRLGGRRGHSQHVVVPRLPYHRTNL